MAAVNPGDRDGDGSSGPQGSSLDPKVNGQDETGSPVRTAVRVEGIVQGVGFRPFVHALATRLALAGLVGNDVDGVFAEVEGSAAAITEFLRALERDAPPLARVERVTATRMPPTGSASFEIVASEPTGRRRTMIAADTATCPDCLRELADPSDRRFRYPFINCTNCGPRFTIVRDVPYDRPLTTMAGFEMCEQCAAEYHDPANRRFHAQPTCCPACGPRLTLLDQSGKPLPEITAEGKERQAGEPLPNNAPEGISQPEEDPRVTSGGNLLTDITLEGGAGNALTGVTLDGGAGNTARREAAQPGLALAAAAAMLRQGRIVAVKGLGGYHLAVDAANEEAVAALRARKHREDKPFAVMTADLVAARRLCQVDGAAASLLESHARPIVLLPRLLEADVAASVAPGNRQLGIMLPYTPLHHVLLEAVGRPLVLTSGNISDEPIAYRDADALGRLAGIADAFLTHDRAIHIRTDDSVARAVGGRPMLIRRSRGYVPEPFRVNGGFPRPVLACGAELKNTFCLAKERHAFVSHHIGDLENAETLRSFTEGIGHFTRLFDITPEVVAYDLHPEYLSTKYALDLEGVDLVGVQHHHAHIASCLADNGIDRSTDGPVIGVAFDGTGYGTDGTIWGGEFLIADLAKFLRVGHLAQVPMPGGAAAIRQPWRMAAAYLDVLSTAGLAIPATPADAPGPVRVGSASPVVLANPADRPGAVRAGASAAGLDVASLPVARRNADRWDTVVAMARRRVNAPLTSSAGRLFDAVAAILGVRDEITYEGQAAIELEQLADPGEARTYRAGIETAPIEAGEPFLVRGADLVAAAVDDLAAGVPAELIAARFHNGVAALIEDGCVLLREQHALNTVALSGGVFQNLLLLGRTVTRLESAGFRVLLHSRVPCNDGGISLGQAVVAAARDRLTPH
jgi:hydrogenase maturation protein HypF